METKEFEQFVASQQEQVGTETDWAQERDGWLGELQSLYERIIGFLQPYIDAGSISYSFADVELTEPEIGTYVAKRMDIRIGKQRISLVPVGTLLIGCKGRVDAEGPAGSAQLLLVNERARSAADLVKVKVSVASGGQLPLAPPEEVHTSWAWKIVARTAPPTFVGLDKGSFFDLLREVAND